MLEFVGRSDRWLFCDFTLRVKMPPPKKPKCKASWEEFLSSVKEDDNSCASGQPPTCCRSEAVLSNGADFKAHECPDVPEDLSLKSGEFHGNDSQQVVSNGAPRVFSALPKDRPDSKDDSAISREHPQLLNILLGLTNGQTSLEAPDNAESRKSYGPYSCSYHHRGNPTFRRPLWTRPVSRDESLSPVALLSVCSDSTERDNVSASEDEEREGVLHKTSTQIQPGEIYRSKLNVNTISRHSGPVYVVKGMGNHPAELNEATGNYDGSRSSGSPIQVGSSRPWSGLQDSYASSDSTTHPVTDSGLMERIRSMTVAPSRDSETDQRSLCQNEATQYKLLEIHSQEFQRKLVSRPMFRSPVMRIAASSSEDTNQRDAVEIHSSPITNGANPSVKRHLKFLLAEEIGLGSDAPPSERNYNDHIDSGAVKRIRTKAPEDISMALFTLYASLEAQRGERPIASNDAEDCSSSPELPSSSSAETAAGGGGVCRCQICDDVASGFHYGVWSCEGCKAFFKRSLHGPVVYICPATNSCTIDKLRRKSCQACRLRKCHEAGMTARTIRKEKGLRILAKKRKSYDDESTVSESEAGSSTTCKKLVCYDDDVGSSRDVSKRNRSLNGGDGSPSPSSCSIPAPNQRQGVRDDATPSDHPLLDRLLAAELPPRLADFDLSSTDSKPQLLTGLMGLINCQLVDVINWSKSLPGFSRSCLESRARLLVMSWPELLILGTVWQSLPHTGTWVCAPNLHLTRTHCQMALIEPLFVRVMTLVQRFRRLQPTRAERVLLRLTILLNSNVDAIDSDPPLAHLRRTLDEAWHLATTTNAGSEPSSLGRAARLLLTLPDVRQCGLMMADVARSVQSGGGGVAAFDLLHEMLDMDCDVLASK